jgi:CheY-like chemotaxis protein
LKIMGHTSQIAYSGIEAIKISAEFRPELVFLDIGLPGMDGFEVCRRLRSNPDLSRTTFIALTGFGTENDKIRAKDAGFALHFVKPVDLQQIVTLLTQEVADRK